MGKMIGKTGASILCFVLAFPAFGAAATAEERVQSQNAEDYEKTEHMVEMRDGVKLHTVVYAPRDKSETYPVILLRTHYSTDAWVGNPMTGSVGPSKAFDEEKFIFVYQDVRGRFASEGEYSTYDPKLTPDGAWEGAGDSTDAYDTVEWIINNVDGHNGKVGMWGISAGGWTTVMGMINAHPALKAFSPQAPVGDLYVGDDVYHNGAFHLAYTFSFLGQALEPKDEEQLAEIAKYLSAKWGYKYFLNLGSLKNIEERIFKKTLESWTTATSHPTYDEYWRKRSVPQYLHNITRPALFVAGWFDAEDFYGTIENYKALERLNPEDNKTSIVIGPWEHGGWYYMDGDTLGDVNFSEKTSLSYREHLFFPFMTAHLKGDGKFQIPEVVAFNTGADQWLQFGQWPPKGAEDRKIFLNEDDKLSWTLPETNSRSAYDSYTSDPSKPVPHTMEIRKNEGSTWIVGDQRFAYARPDVLSYISEPLNEDTTIAGRVEVGLMASTSGTDSDWVVKLIDVYPGAAPDADDAAKELAGRQQLVAGEIMRGRYRESLSEPKPMKPGSTAAIEFSLPDRLHTFKKGHRIMVQVQSSWFPAFDRNPQKYVDIFNADDEDFQAAVQKIYRSRNHASYLRLPVIPEDAKSPWEPE